VHTGLYNRFIVANSLEAKIFREEKVC